MKRDFELLAERTLILANNKTGEKREFKIQIGYPYWTEFGVEAACPVVLEGLINRRQDIYGIDLMGAVEMSLKYINSFLSEHSQSEEVCWPNGEPYFE